MNKKVIVNGMGCAACANNVQKKLSELAFINAVSVDFVSKTAVIEGATNYSIDDLNAVLQDSPYSVNEFQN